MYNNVDFVRLLQGAQDESDLRARKKTQAHKRVKENRMLEQNV